MESNDMHCPLGIRVNVGDFSDLNRNLTCSKSYIFAKHTNHILFLHSHFTIQHINQSHVWIVTLVTKHTVCQIGTPKEGYSKCELWLISVQFGFDSIGYNQAYSRWNWIFWDCILRSLVHNICRAA